MARTALRNYNSKPQSVFVALLFAPALLFLFLTSSTAAQTQAFQGSGSAELSSDSLTARDKACANAARAAIERAIESILDANTIKEHKADIEDLLAGTKRYAKQTETMLDEPSGREYRCRLRITVDTGLLSKDIKESFSSGRALGPRIMVIVDDPNAAAAFQKTLRDKDYQIVDEEYAKTIREQRIRVMGEFLSDSSRVANLAKEVGAARNVNWLVLGNAKVSAKETGGIRSVGDGSMVVRIVDTSTGEVIASGDGTKSIEEIDHNSALSAVGAAIGQALADKLVPQVAEYLKIHGAQGQGGLGSRMTVNLFNVARGDTALSFQAYLKSLPGVVDVQQINFDGKNNLLELNVAFRGAATDLTRLALEQLSRAPDLSQLSLKQSGGSAIDFLLDPNAAPRSFSSLSFEARLDNNDPVKLIEAGKRFNLRVNVKNSGSGPANNVQVHLAGDPAIISAAGSQKAAGNIAPGQTQVVEFAGVVPSLTDERSAEIRVTVGEGSSQLPQSEVLRVALVPAIDVDTPPGPVSLPDRASSLAVVIGITNYRESVIPKLPYASRDAEIFAKYLENTAGMRRENIKFLSDDHATRSDIEDAIERWLPLRAESGSHVYVYYAGHGAIDPMPPGDTYLVPYEGSPDAPATRMYPLKRLYEKLGQLKVQDVMVFLDSCFSGGGRSIAMRGRPIVISSNTEPASNVIVLAAADANQVSSDYDRMRHGLFTYFLLKGIQGGARAGSDGWIDLEALSTFVTANVTKTAKQEWTRDQTPKLLGGASKKNAKLFKIQK